MRTSGPLLALAVVAATGAAPSGPAAAQSCTTPLPAGMESWINPTFPKMGTVVPLGQAVRPVLALDPALSPAPAKPPAKGTYGGSVWFEVKTAGTYRVSLGAPAWIDVLRGGKSVASTAHGHGEPCSPIVKRVDFALTPGRYALQLSGSKAPAVIFMVAPAR